MYSRWYFTRSNVPRLPLFLGPSTTAGTPTLSTTTLDLNSSLGCPIFANASTTHPPLGLCLSSQSLHLGHSMSLV